MSDDPFEPKPPNIDPPKLKPKTLVDLTKEQQSEIKTGAAMEAISNLEGWTFYRVVLEKHLEMKRNESEQGPIPGEDGQGYGLRMERVKGTIIGIRLALGLPSIMIETAKSLRKQLLGAESED